MFWGPAPRHQSIIIGDDITVTVSDIRGDKVRLGVSAPRHIAVHRKEIYDQIKRENQQAGTLSVDDVAGVIPEPVQKPRLRLAGASLPEHREFLDAALDEAKQSITEGGIPIGAVLVRNNQIIAKGHNRRIQTNDPTAHAEMDCLRNAGPQETYRDTVLYTTLMPCHMCSGTAAHFGIPRVVAGESVNVPTHRNVFPNAKRLPASEFLRSVGVEVIDLHDPDCIALLDEFLKNHPNGLG